MRRIACFAFVFSFLACVGDDPATSGLGGGADTNGTDGGDGGDRERGGPSECAVAARCTDDGGSLVTCKGIEPCNLGCDVPSGRCKTIAASGAAGTVDATGADAAIVLDGKDTYWFDTSTGIIGKRDESGTPVGAPLRAGGGGVVSGIGFASVAQSDGSKIGVWVFRSLTIAKDAVLKVFGSDAIALIAQGDLVVDGTVSVRGDCARGIAGPGAADPTSARTGKPGESKNTNPGFKFICGGGGGGGNGTAGGDGGWASGTNPENTTVQALGGEHGTPRDKTLIDDPLLVGGGAGANGGNGTGGTTIASGGVGGGAVQLVASGTLTISGLVDAGGCGGVRGYAGTPPINTQRCRGAGGGGAGGTIFLEASAIHIVTTGRVLANGGGGGGGSTSNEPAQNADGAANAVDGARAPGGQADARRAAGGSCSPGQDGNVSGAPELAAGPCAVGDIAVAASGGGGGFGSVAARTRDATFVTDDGGVVNPAPARSIAAVK